MTGDLVALAERVEKATGADREIDRDIALAFDEYDQPEDLGCFADPARAVIGGGGRTYAPPAYTASLDAAVSLVPEGHGWRLWVPDKRQASDDDRPFVTIWGSGRTMAPRDVIAATPALALVSAALRARAQESGHG